MVDCNVVFSLVIGISSVVVLCAVEVMRSVVLVTAFSKVSCELVACSIVASLV